MAVNGSVAPGLSCEATGFRYGWVGDDDLEQVMDLGLNDQGTVLLTWLDGSTD